MTKQTKSNTAHLSLEAEEAAKRLVEINEQLATLHKQKARCESRIAAAMNGKRFGVCDGMCFELQHRVAEYTIPASAEAHAMLLESGLEFSRRYPTRKKTPTLKRIT